MSTREGFVSKGEQQAEFLPVCVESGAPLPRKDSAVITSILNICMLPSKRVLFPTPLRMLTGRSQSIYVRILQQACAPRGVAEHEEHAQREAGREWKRTGLQR